ncbi:MAG: HD domain-containing protein [Saprospiraceae bacterium]
MYRSHGGKCKIFNDPVYGFVSVPHGLLLQIIDHPYVQRLRRIRQMGLSHFVYPGALHTRFNHALGALHLMQEAIEVLRSKGTEISTEEAEAVCAAILLHDVGHGPFSHALEHTLLHLHHESISLLFMEELNRQMDGRLELAIQIFSDKYHKKFLHQLVSGQLDMDRMDYLNRDSFFSGVSEGVIGYDRIIKMLAVHDGELVVEEKGIYSIEKFLMARRFMYWQVYLHKTSVSAEQMLIHLLQRAGSLARSGFPVEASRDLSWFLEGKSEQEENPAELLRHFARLDDTDIAVALKNWTYSEDFLLNYLSTSLLERKLFRLEWHLNPVDKAYRQNILNELTPRFEQCTDPSGLIYEGTESNQAYDDLHEPIRIVFKDGRVLAIEKCSDVPLYTQAVTKFFICYPKPVSS